MAFAAPEPQIGTTVSIAVGVPATEDQSGYEAQSFTEIGKVTSIPELTEQSQEGTVTLLKNGVVQRYNGSLGTDSFDISYVYDSTDAGQGVVRSNFNGSTEVTLKIAYNDGTTKYCWGVLGNLRTNQADADSYHGEMINMRPSSSITTVTA